MRMSQENKFFLITGVLTSLIVAVLAISFLTGTISYHSLPEIATGLLSQAVLFAGTILAVRKGMVGSENRFLWASLGGVVVRMFSVLLLLVVGINLLKFNGELFIIVILLFYFYFLFLELVYIISIGPKLKR